jgi:hypothetical protein
LGKSLLEKVEVKERRCIKEKPRYSDRMGPYQGNAWSLRVVNERGQGWVRVSKELHDSVHEGDTLYVQGKHALISRRWFLWEASKKPPKKVKKR